MEFTKIEFPSLGVKSQADSAYVRANHARDMLSFPGMTNTTTGPGTSVDVALSDRWYVHTKARHRRPPTDPCRPTNLASCGTKGNRQARGVTASCLAETLGIQTSLGIRCTVQWDGHIRPVACRRSRQGTLFLRLAYRSPASVTAEEGWGRRGGFGVRSTMQTDSM